MTSYLNTNRPPVYCPGCTHEKITTQLDRAMANLNLTPEKTVMVTDIGCSGLFDTFFNVHAVHGIHGRALTYGTGLKMAAPDLTVIVTMGDGGLGIGAAHVLAACRKNLDMTLIILNNFNFGMTGGQYSLTTPADASVGSSFLNQAEIPIDICEVAESSGATFVARCSGLAVDLPDTISRAIGHKGFSVVETLGVCTGRYTKNNKLTPKLLQDRVEELPGKKGVVNKNIRPEYGLRYRTLAKEKKSFPASLSISQEVTTTQGNPQEILILGSAGMRIVTAGDILCYAGMFAGMNVTQKNDYNITVLKGHSVSEILISDEKIGFTGSESPTVILALSEEGVARKKTLFSELSHLTTVLYEKSVALPETYATCIEADFKGLKISKQDWALGALGVLAKMRIGLTEETLYLALKKRFNEKPFLSASKVVSKVLNREIQA